MASLSKVSTGSNYGRDLKRIPKEGNSSDLAHPCSSECQSLPRQIQWKWSLLRTARGQSNIVSPLGCNDQKQRYLGGKKNKQENLNKVRAFFPNGAPFCSKQLVCWFFLKCLLVIKYAKGNSWEWIWQFIFIFVKNYSQSKVYSKSIPGKHIYKSIQTKTVRRHAVQKACKPATSSEC